MLDLSYRTRVKQLSDDLKTLENFLPLFELSRGSPSPTKTTAAAAKVLTEAKKAEPDLDRILNLLLDENIDFLILWRIAEVALPDRTERYIQDGYALKDLEKLVEDDLPKIVRMVDAIKLGSEAKKQRGRGGKRHTSDPHIEYVLRDLIATYRYLTRMEPSITIDPVSGDGKGAIVEFCWECLHIFGLTHLTSGAVAQRIQRIVAKHKADPEGYDLGPKLI